MSSDFQVASRAHRHSTRFHGKFLLILAIAVVAAFAAPASASAAFGISNFAVTPSTTTQSANPDLTVEFDRTGRSSEDLRATNLTLPAGLGFDPAAVPKCSAWEFSKDRCPAASKVGRIAARVKYSFGHLRFTDTVDGSVYARTNSQLGIVVRPDHFSKAFITQNLTQGAAGVQISTTNIPRFAYLFGWFHVNSTIQSVEITYQGKAGASGAGPVVVTNPSVCSPATSTLVATSYQNASVTRTSAFTPTGCSTGPSAPVVSITSPANGAFLDAADASIAFTASESPTSIECALDGAAAAACTSPQQYNGLADGLHTVVVTATNAVGSGSATVNFSVDTADPTVNITAPADGSTSSSSSTNVLFTADGTGSGVSGTTCKLDAGAASACTSGQAYSGLSVGSHTITVEATDQAGNTGSSSTTFSVTAPIPVPVVTISSPTNGAFLNVDNTSVAFTATNSPTSITCKLDAAAATACTSPQAYNSLSQGAHTVVVTATNASGSGSATVNFTVDTLAPTVNITAPADGSSSSNTSTNVVFTASGTGSGVAGTTCKLDAGAAVSCTSGQAFSGLALGSHTITVEATDQAGNTGSSSTTFSVTAPVPVPVVTISSPAEGALLNTTSTSVAFTATNSPTSTTCKLDAAAAAACTSPQAYSSLGQGAHTVVVTATNASGSGSATVNFTVDSLNPTVNITAPANGSSSSSTSTNAVFTSDGTGSSVTGTTCKLDAAAAAACTSPEPYSGLALGSHTITVVATDQAGNVGSASTTFTVVAPTPAPEVTITSPANGAFLNTTNTSVVFSATNSPTSTTCKLDAAAATACTSPQAYGSLSQGAHTIVVTANNASGSGSATVNFTVDSLNPTVSITAPANGSSSTSTSTNAVFTANGTGTSVTGTTCKLDAAAATSCVSGQAYSGLSVGSHTIVVAATDQAGNTGSSSTTFDVTAPIPPPVVTISSPANNAFLNTTSTSVAFTATNSPTSTTCKLDAAAATACTSPQAYSSLGQGAHTVVVTATNASGSGSATVNFTVDSLNPTVNITAPANGSSSSSTSTNAVFTSDGTGSSVTGTTCKLDAAAATSCVSGQAYSGLSVGSHTIVVAATDQAGNVGSSSTTFSVTSAESPPTVTITSAPGPATADTTPTYSFTTTGPATTITCQMDGGAATPCTSPFTPAAQTSPALHTFTVNVSNGAGSQSKSTTTLVDTRPFNITATVTKVANTLTSAANVSLPAQHPNVQSTITLEGAEDVQNATLVLPHGLNGSLKAIPEASRCSLAQAANGTCPLASRIGTGSGQIVVTDSSTQLTVTGEGYLTDAPTSADAAGIAIKATVPGGRGDIIATGGVKLTNNGTTQEATAANLPITTTTGVPFHATSMDVTIQGDVGGASAPLVTNPSYCNNAAGSTFWAPYNAATNAFGYKGQFVNIVGNATSYAASNDTVTVPYTISGCSTTVAPYAPTLTHVLSSTTPGTNAALKSTLTVPANNSTTQRVSLLMPPKLGPNLASFGSSSDMCGNASLTNITAGTTGVGNRPFDPTSCPAQARVGQAVITTPLLEDPVIADIYLINKIPLPWIGIHIDPTISPQNPQGVTIDLVGTTGLPTVNGICNSDTLGEPCGGPGTNICDEATQGPCQTQISANFSIMPDVPISTAVINLGRMADGTTPPPGRVGVGGITSNEVLQTAPVGETTCANGTNPSGTILSGSGTPEDPYVTAPYTQSAVATLVGWSRTTATGGVVAGGNASSSQVISTPGC